MNIKDLRKHKSQGRGILHQTYNLYPGHNNTERTTYFDHPKMMVVVRICIGDKHGGYWNDTKEVLLDAIYNGHAYRLGLDQFKSERSLCLRINNFVKHILNDNPEKSK